MLMIARRLVILDQGMIMTSSDSGWRSDGDCQVRIWSWRDVAGRFDCRAAVRGPRGLSFQNCESHSVAVAFVQTALKRQRMG
jgi:hypothetical protein